MKTSTPSKAGEPVFLKSEPLGDIHDVQDDLNVCRTVVENLLRTDPDFPQPISIASKRQWFMTEIAAYKASRPRRRYADSAA